MPVGPPQDQRGASLRAEDPTGHNGATADEHRTNGRAANGIARVRVFDAPRRHETVFLGGHSDTVTGVSFGPDGSRLYSESANERLVWDVAKQQPIPGALWEPADGPVLTTPDRRWFATAESNNVVLVDLHYKNTTEEEDRRVAKARFDPFWHEERAATATKAENWCEAVFHYAWLAKHDPDLKSFSDGLQSSLQKLKSQYGDPKGEQLFSRFSR